MRDKLDRIFSVAIIALLLVAFVEGWLTPVENVENENRTAEQFYVPAVSELLDGSYQSDFDAAVSDQLIGSEKIRQLYNAAAERLGFLIMKPVLENNPERYIRYGGDETIAAYGIENLMYLPLKFKDHQKNIDMLIENYNNVARVLKERAQVDFYVHYAEGSRDINFETGEHVGYASYVLERLELPEDHMALFEVDSFEEFSEKFYHTDHHWNHIGSYEAYVQMVEMLGIPEEQWLKPLEEKVISDSFSGSMSSAIGSDLFSETFSAYWFDYPEMQVMINDKEYKDYGQQESYWEGNSKNPVSYERFYGRNYGRIILKTENTEADNILVIGTSYDNALIKLLASHYHELHSLDFRYYGDVYDESFNIVEYVQKNDIDIVLVAGGVSLFKNNKYRMEV